MKTVDELQTAKSIIDDLLNLKSEQTRAQQKEAFQLHVVAGEFTKQITDPEGVEGFRQYYLSMLERQIREQQSKVDNLLQPIVYPRA